MENFIAFLLKKRNIDEINGKFTISSNGGSNGIDGEMDGGFTGSAKYISIELEKDEAVFESEKWNNTI